MSVFAVCLTTLVYGSLCIAYYHTNLCMVPIIYKNCQGTMIFSPRPQTKNPYDIELPLPLSGFILSLTIYTKHNTNQHTNILWTTSYGRELSSVNSPRS